VHPAVKKGEDSRPTHAGSSSSFTRERDQEAENQSDAAMPCSMQSTPNRILRVPHGHHRADEAIGTKPARPTAQHRGQRPTAIMATSGPNRSGMFEAGAELQGESWPSCPGWRERGAKREQKCAEGKLEQVFIGERVEQIPSQANGCADQSYSLSVAAVFGQNAVWIAASSFRPF